MRLQFEWLSCAFDADPGETFPSASILEQGITVMHPRFRYSFPRQTAHFFIFLLHLLLLLTTRVLQPQCYPALKLPLLNKLVHIFLLITFGFSFNQVL